MTNTEDIRSDYIIANTRNHDAYMTGVSIDDERQKWGGNFDDWLASEKNELLWDVTDFVTRHYLDTGVGQAILEELTRMRIQLGESR